MFPTILDPMGKLWCKTQQGANRFSRPGARPQFQHLSEEHENHDETGCFEINGHLSIVREAVRQQSGKKQRENAEGIGRARPERNQSKHVETSRDYRTHSALKERPPAPKNHRCRQHELNPRRDFRRDRIQTEEVRAHRENQHRQSQHQAHFETQEHRAQLGVLVLPGGLKRLKGHAANRTNPRMVLPHLGVHRTRVEGTGLPCESRISLKRHSALWACAWLIRLHTRTHRAIPFLRGLHGRRMMMVMAVVMLRFPLGARLRSAHALNCHPSKPIG